MRAAYPTEFEIIHGKCKHPCDRNGRLVARTAQRDGDGDRAVCDARYLARTAAGHDSRFAAGVESRDDGAAVGHHAWRETTARLLRLSRRALAAHAVSADAERRHNARDLIAWRGRLDRERVRR